MSRKRAKTTVLVVEDGPHILGFLRFLLESEGYEVVAVSDSDHTIQALETPADPFDLAILDVADGLDLLHQIRLAGNMIPIIYLSGEDDPQSKAQALWVGADDCLAKPFDPGELMATLRAILRRARSLPSVSVLRPTVRVGDVELDGLARRVRTSGGKEAELTATETKLLACFMANAGKVLSVEELMSNVWGDGHRRSYYSLAAHVSRLRGKMEENPTDPSHIRSVKGAGYVFRTA